jgi:multicomponent Na+:H+ antiporter subunit D
MDGIGRKMPFTMVAFAIGVLGMLGVPPSGGFITKWYLVVGSMQAESLVILFVLLSSTILNGAYFVPIVYKAFFKSPIEEHGDGHGEEIKENPFIVVPLMITAIGSVVLGLYPDILLAFIRGVV